MNPAGFSLRELELLAVGRVSHCWDLLAPLICYVVNPHIKKALKPEKIHPYWEKKKGKAFFCNRKDWTDLKAALKGKRQLIVDGR